MSASRPLIEQERDHHSHHPPHAVRAAGRAWRRGQIGTPDIGPVYRRHFSPSGSRVTALRTHYHYAPSIDTHAQQAYRCVHPGATGICPGIIATPPPCIPLQCGYNAGGLPLVCPMPVTALSVPDVMPAHQRMVSLSCTSRARCVPTTVAYDDPSHHVPWIERVV